MTTVTITTDNQTLTVQILHGGHWGQGTVISHDDQKLGRPVQRLTESEVENLQAYWYMTGQIDSIN